MKRLAIPFILICVYLMPAKAENQSARIAVASNFQETLDTLVASFEQTYPMMQVQTISGSTGKLYAQIKSGAPFDAFFAADALRPERLEKEGFAQANSRFTYALGVIVVWTRNAELFELGCSEALRHGSIRHIAVANPKLAPYGLASLQEIERQNWMASLRDKLVYGENIAQCYHFVYSGAADIGFIALSQVRSKPVANSRSWRLDPAVHDPIEQQVVLLSDNSVAMAFLQFCKSDHGKELIKQAGYELP